MMSEGGGQGLTSGRKTGLKPLPTNKTDAKGKNMGQSPNFGRSSQRHAGHKTQGEKNGSERASQLTQTAKLTFVFNCDKVPDGNKAELEIEFNMQQCVDGLKVPIKPPTYIPVSDAERAKIWRDFQLKLKSLYVIKHKDLSVFTFQDKDDKTKELAVVVNATHFSDLLDLNCATPTINGSRTNNFIFEGKPDGFSGRFVFKHELKLAHSILIPPTHKCQYKITESYAGPAASEVRDFCLATGGVQKSTEGTSHESSATETKKAYGELTFRHDSSKATAKFCLVRDRQREHRFQKPGTNPHLLRYLLEDVWKLPTPQILVEITGSAQGLQLSKEDRTDINESIFSIAKKMRGWVVTGGFDTGVMSLMGEGRVKYAPEVPLIGFCSWAKVHQKELLEVKQAGARMPVYFNRSSKPKDGMSSLNPDHSHFIIVDAGSNDHGQEINMRADLVSVISSFNWHSKGGEGEHIHSDIVQHLHSERLMWPGEGGSDRSTTRQDSRDALNETIPCIQICIRGGEGTLRTISETLDSGVPAILVKGSGGAADLVSELYERLYGQREQDGGARGSTLESPVWMQNRETVVQHLLKTNEGLYGAFISMDRSKNGIISADEFKQSVEAILQEYEIGNAVDSPSRTMNVDAEEPSLEEYRYGHFSQDSDIRKRFEEAHNLLTQYQNIKNDFDDDDFKDAKTNEVFKAMLTHLYDGNDTGAGRGADPLNARPKKDAPGLAAQKLWDQVKAVSPIFDYTHPHHSKPAGAEAGGGGGFVTDQSFGTRSNDSSVEGIARRLVGGSDYEKEREKKHCLNFTNFVQNMALGGLGDESGSGGTTTLTDLWQKHGMVAPGKDVAMAVKDNRSYLINILKQRENIVVYDSTFESTSLQKCMCLAIIHRTHNPLELKAKLLLCIEWGMLDVTREVLEDSHRFKGTRNFSWKRDEALNKGFSRALKQNKKSFVQLFLDYGADIGRYNLETLNQQNTPVIERVEASGKVGRLLGKVNRVLPFRERDDGRRRPLDKDARDRFEKLFGLSKGHIDRNVDHLRKLLDGKRSDHWAGSSIHSEGAPKRLKRYDIKTVDLVLRDLLGNDFEGHIGGFGGPYNDLFVWAVLMGWNELALYFWEKCKHPLKMALTAALMYRNMARSNACLGRDDLKDSFSDYGSRFEALALKLQMTATKDDPMLSLHALERMWPEWINEDGMHLTNYDIAVRARCDLFMDKQKNYMCFRAQQERWSGDISYTGYWGLSPEAWAVLMTFPMFWPLFMFASFNAGILQKPPKKENRRLPAQRHGLMMKWRQRPKHATESEEDYDALPKSAMSNVEAFVLFQIAPVTKFVRHSIFYFIFVIFMSYDLLSATLVSDGPRMENAASSDPGKGPFTWIRILVISNAVAINVHQYTRIYQVCKIDGLWPNIWSEYFKRFWNRNEFIAIMTYLLGIVIEVFDVRMARNLHAASFIFFWFQVLNTLSVNRNMGPLLVAIGKMFNDIANWMVIFVIIVIGFGGAMHAATQSSVGQVAVCTDAMREAATCVADADLVASSLGGNLNDLNWIIRAYFQVFGEFDLGETAEAGLYPMIILMVYAMITNVLMVNLLVAMMGSTYEKVKEMSEVEWMYQMYSTNNEYLIPNEFDAPFNVIKIVLWTLPKLLLSLVFGDSSTKKNNWETNPLDLNEPDSQVEAIVERCRDLVISDKEVFDFGAKDDSEEAETKVMLVGEKLTKLEAMLEAHLLQHTDNLTSLIASKAPKATGSLISMIPEGVSTASVISTLNGRSTRTTARMM